MSRLTDLLEELGVLVDTQLFELAFTHRSYAYENGGTPSNERLEFLGDAVLQIVVTEHIFTTYPELAEGDLAKLRASVVSTHALADLARELELAEHLLLGKGELATGGHNKASILADTTEAVIGAVHLSAGAEASAAFVHAMLDERITAHATAGTYSDFKTALQELSTQRGLGVPIYEVVGTGPDHLREFTATAIVGGEPRGSGTAPSKKLAEQRAATAAFRAMEDTDA